MVPAVAATNPGNSKYDGAGGWCNTKTGASMEILKMMKIGKQDCHIILWLGGHPHSRHDFSDKELEDVTLSL